MPENCDCQVMRQEEMGGGETEPLHITKFSQALNRISIHANILLLMKN